LLLFEFLHIAVEILFPLFACLVRSEVGTVNIKGNCFVRFNHISRNLIAGHAGTLKKYQNTGYCGTSYFHHRTSSFQLRSR